MTWEQPAEPLSRASLVSTNYNRFIPLDAVQDADGGVDFQWALRSSHGSTIAGYIAITSYNPLGISSTMSIP